jgi:hypothetical protein
LGGPNAAIPPAGSEEPNAATFAGISALEGEASDRAGSSNLTAGSNAAIPPAGSEAAGCSQNATRFGRRSECEPHRELILAKLDQGLSAQRIWQDLAADHGFTAAYDSVKRFVRSLGGDSVAPFRRFEMAPGEEAQVDFGAGAPIVNAEGKRRKSHVFRIVLSHSRKGYSEATFTQTTEDFIRCLENAFAHFGGAPKTLVIDYVPGHIIVLMCPTSLCGVSLVNGLEVRYSQGRRSADGHIIAMPKCSTRISNICDTKSPSVRSRGLQ